MNLYQVLDNKISFSCGCEFNRNGNEISFNPDLHNPSHTIKFDCSETYRLLSEGLTEGIFQLGSPLGKTWCKKLIPTEMEHISALGALLRPGCLEAKDNKGNSITVRYERKKNGKMELTNYHPIVDKILESTYGENIYQESSLELAKQCAGFSLSEADTLRKGIGKKIPEIIAKCKKDFMEKGKVLGILTDQQLEEVFSWIEASQRYSFNHSHSWSYGLNGYVTAYLKAHFPLQFYKSWLSNEDKRENYVNFVNEAKIFNINVYPPDIRDCKVDFYCKGKNIYFGLGNIKGLVKKDLDKLTEVFAEKEWGFSEVGEKITWMDFLSVALENVSSKTSECLIRSGALDVFGVDRAILLYEYERWNELTVKEKELYQIFKEDPENIGLAMFVYSLIFSGEAYHKKKLEEYKEKVEQRKNSTRTYKTALQEPKENRRLPKLRQIFQELHQPVYTIQDTIDSTIFAEEDLLGVALTRHKTDEIPNCAETASCKDILSGNKSYQVLRVKIENCRAYKCKNGASAGREMAFITVSDKTSQLPVVAFPDVYDEFRHLLTRGNLCFISGQLDKDSFIVKRCYNVN